MQTQLSEQVLASASGKRAEEILRRCVHCGFCNNVCPTYRQLGDELDGPRGRIYQMKRFLEGEEASDSNLLHLDRCLTCQSCESACPSGVDYLDLLEIVRPQVAQEVPRSLWVRARRRLACWLLLKPRLLAMMVNAARALRVLLPAAVPIPARPLPASLPMSLSGREDDTKRHVVIPDGCVQSAIAPDINRHTAAVLSHIGVGCRQESGFCCGALQLHLEQKPQALARIRRNVDRLYDALQSGAEAVVTTASGCGRTIADYGHLLADDKHYAARAAAVSAAHRDIAAFLIDEDLSHLQIASDEAGLSFHCPCTLYHHQKQQQTVQRIFARLGAPLPAVANAGQCCGSAGFYSVEQPDLAARLRANIIDAHAPAEKIITANIGCQLHLQQGTDKPVRHWIQMVVSRG